MKKLADVTAMQFGHRLLHIWKKEENNCTQDSSQEYILNYANNPASTVLSGTKATTEFLYYSTIEFYCSTLLHTQATITSAHTILPQVVSDTCPAV